MGTSFFSSFSYAARAEFERRGLELPLGRVQELMAAVLGYSSKAAMDSSSEEAHGGIEVAASVVADHEMLEKRLRALEVRDTVTARIFVIVLILITKAAEPKPHVEFINPEDFRYSDAFGNAHNSIGNALAASPRVQEIVAQHSLTAFEDDLWDVDFDPYELQAVNGRWVARFAGSARITAADADCLGKYLRYEGSAWVAKPGRRCLSADWHIGELDVRISDTPIEIPK